MTAAFIRPGDLYCVFCLSECLSMRIMHGDQHTWECDNCRRVFEHPFHVDDNGWFAWTWDDQHPQPNAGCPWCGTCNLGYTGGLAGQWRCLRQSCGKFWRGRYTQWTDTDDGSTRYRWTIHVPVGTVPWASGTTADLECYRRVPGGLRIEHSDYFPACCRWPKSCSAYDPGFAVGKGPTALPVVWFDGFGWRSGPPDPKTTPQHLFDEIRRRWLGALPMTSTEEANDDDGDDCGNGCEYICYHPEART